MKNVLKRIGILVLLLITIFSALPAYRANAENAAPTTPTGATAATPAKEGGTYSFESLFKNIAYCGGATDSDDGNYLRYGVFCYISVGLQLIILAVLYGIGTIFALLLKGFAFASVWMIDFGIGKVTTLGAVSVGFKISLEVANLMFVVAIIILAFATILRWHEYEAKKMLPRLIFAALLVNFSFLIAGLLLDFSNVFTNYFLAHFSSGSIGESLNPQIPILNKDYKIGGGEHSWEDFIVIFPQVIFTILITFTMMMSMIAVFIMALIRNLWVLVLLITMPLAWGSWVIPKLEGYWKKWWENFINWGVIYLPIVTFFLFLAVRTMNYASEIGAVGTLIPQADQSAGFGSFIDTALSNAVSSLIVIGIIIAGLKVAQSLGSNVAGTFANLAGRGGKKLAGGLLKTSGLVTAGTVGAGLGALKGGLGGIGKEYSRGGSGSLLGVAKSAGKNALSGMSAGAQAPEKAARGTARFLAKVLGATNRVPILGGLASPAAAALSKAANSQAGLEAIQARWKDLQGEDLKAALVGTMRGLGTSNEKAAALAYMAKNHKLDWLDDEKDPARVLAAVATLKSMSPSTKAKRNATLKAIAGHFSAFAPQITGELPEEALARQSAADMRAHDAEHVAHDIDSYTASQLAANASASGKNDGIIRAAVASAIASSKAFKSDGEMAKMVKALEETNKTLDKLGTAIDEKSLSDRRSLSAEKKRLVLEISSRINEMTDDQKKLLDSVDKDRLQKWERLKRTVGSAEPADHHDSHGGHEKTTMGEIREALGKDFSIGDVKSSGGHGGGGHGGGGGGGHGH